MCCDGLFTDDINLFDQTKSSLKNLLNKVHDCYVKK